MPSSMLKGGKSFPFRDKSVNMAKMGNVFCILYFSWESTYPARERIKVKIQKLFLFLTNILNDVYYMQFCFFMFVLSTCIEII